MTEKTQRKKAVALLYDQAKSAAPKVVASGSNLIAETIIQTAIEAGVHIKEDPDLVELLAGVPVGEEIPAELYQTIAEVLAFVYAVNSKFKEKLEAQTKEQR
ncbi:EscU/YscU/HrcU family type III secretion system export apparatus switch protein [Desulfobulbus alkaliphilus]|uniref:EscU/YscU/HrcU family type III secretion system export apparatus switch protein n=1 Tax=Desulfobulbus alkaliphilus TaxID=869814 RepID=UPI001963E5F4|nr:EscU/YscU/HrcU family type III secretion system export apparatus switch protein [Desulfobulbus alkaliphilus]MBM9535475.1 EscU/YscU/HrcU family type III secretion system export apparatus switch protein [Desulfobulbus alkaliphilus]